MPATRRALRAGSKGERLEARISAKQKQQLQRAAVLRGTSLSDFVVTTALEAAHRTVADHHVWRLTERDREAFVGALLNPPAPNPRLAAAARRYLEKTGSR